MKIYHYPEFDGSRQIYAVTSKYDGACVIYDYLATLRCNNAVAVKRKIVQLILRLAMNQLRNDQKFKSLNDTGTPPLYELKHNEHRLYGIFIDSGFLFLYCSGNKDKQSLNIKMAKEVRKKYQTDFLKGNINMESGFLNGF